jgi:cytochrome c oxidase cbb3-type subunit 4
MDVNILREAMTVMSFATFVGIVAYAVSPGMARRFDEAAQLPPDEEGK